MKTWKQRAAEAVKAGYQTGNPWEGMLRRHLAAFFPELVRELGKDLEPYIQTKTSQAMDLMHGLTDSGTNPHTARELAMADLLPRPTDEVDRPEPWEIESAGTDLEAAALKGLLSSRLPSPQQRTTRLT